MVTYHEHILKKEKSGKDFVISLVAPFGCAFGAYILSFLVANFVPFFAFLIPALWAGAVYASYKIISGRNIEFEYLLVDSDLDIDKIINRNRRKRLISVYRKEILAMAPVGSKNLPEGWQSLEKIDASSNPEAEGAYVLVVQQDTGKKAIIFCPTDTMLDTMTARNPRKVFKD